MKEHVSLKTFSYFFLYLLQRKATVEEMQCAPTAAPGKDFGKIGLV